MSQLEDFMIQLDRLQARSRETADELVADPLNMEKMKAAIEAAKEENAFLRTNMESMKQANG